MEGRGSGRAAERGGGQLFSGPTWARQWTTRPAQRLAWTLCQASGHHRPSEEAPPGPAAWGRASCPPGWGSERAMHPVSSWPGASMAVSVTRPRKLPSSEGQISRVRGFLPWRSVGSRIRHYWQCPAKQRRAWEPTPGFFLENLMDRGTRRATAHGVTMSQT